MLFGDLGADAFLFARPEECGDVVRDFASGEDRIEIVGSGFGLTAIGQIAPEMFESGSGLPAVLAKPGPVFYLETGFQGLWFDPTGGTTDDILIVAGFETGTPEAADIFIV